MCQPGIHSILDLDTLDWGDFSYKSLCQTCIFATRKYQEPFSSIPERISTHTHSETSDEKDVDPRGMTSSFVTYLIYCPLNRYRISASQPPLNSDLWQVLFSFQILPHCLKTDLWGYGCCIVLWVLRLETNYVLRSEPRFYSCFFAGVGCAWTKEWQGILESRLRFNADKGMLPVIFPTILEIDEVSAFFVYFLN